MIQFRRLINRLRISPSTRRTLEYLEFDRAVKLDATDAVARGVSLLKRHPSDKLLRKRTGAVAYKSGHKQLASEILLGGLSQSQKNLIDCVLNRINLGFQQENPDSWFEIIPGGTQATCLAVFYKDGLSKIAVAKVLNKWHLGHRNEIRFYRNLQSSQNSISQLPGVISIENVGKSNVVIVMEYVYGRRASFEDAECIRLNLERLQLHSRTLGNKRVWPSFVAILLDISHVVAVFFFRKTLSLRFLVRWLHKRSISLLLRLIIKIRGKVAKSQWEAAFGGLASRSLGSPALCRRLFPANNGDLVHGDLNRGNVLVSDGRTPRDCVFIDWENWHYGFREYDFARFFEAAKPSMVEAFAVSLSRSNVVSPEENTVRQARFIFLWLIAELFSSSRTGCTTLEDKEYMNLINRLDSLMFSLRS
jgi:hypothetical protein